MEKNKVLPLVQILGENADQPTVKWTASAETQRDVDWKKMQPLIEALEKIVMNEEVYADWCACPSCIATKALAGLEVKP